MSERHEPSSPAPATARGEPLGQPGAPRTARGGGPVLLALLAAGLAVAVYANALHGPFVYDDTFEIVRNQSIRDLANPPRSFAA